MSAPVTGRSVSFRCRFRFVRVARALRAGEAKLRGHMTIVVGIAGPPGSEYPGVVLVDFRLASADICIKFSEVSSPFCATNFSDHRNTHGSINVNADAKANAANANANANANADADANANANTNAANATVNVNANAYMRMLTLKLMLM